MFIAHMILNRHSEPRRGDMGLRCGNHTAPAGLGWMGGEESGRLAVQQKSIRRRPNAPIVVK